MHGSRANEGSNKEFVSVTPILALQIEKGAFLPWWKGSHSQFLYVVKAHHEVLTSLVPFNYTVVSSASMPFIMNLVHYRYCIIIIGSYDLMVMLRCSHFISICLYHATSLLLWFLVSIGWPFLLGCFLLRLLATLGSHNLIPLLALKMAAQQVWSLRREKHRA